MELHNQALKYLQQHARRCVSCGEGQFAKLLGKVSKQEDRQKQMADIDNMFEMEFEDISATEEETKSALKRFFLDF